MNAPAITSASIRSIHLTLSVDKGKWRVSGKVTLETELWHETDKPIEDMWTELSSVVSDMTRPGASYMVHR